MELIDFKSSCKDCCNKTTKLEGCASGVSYILYVDDTSIPATLRYRNLQTGVETSVAPTGFVLGSCIDLLTNATEVVMGATTPLVGSPAPTGSKLLYNTTLNKVTAANVGGFWIDVIDGDLNISGTSATGHTIGAFTDEQGIITELRETITSLGTPTLDTLTNILSIPYTDETGAVITRTVDLAGLAIDINVQSFSIDSTNGELIITETDGTTHTVDIFPVAATNGLSPIGDAIGLGGTLIQDTIIEQDDFNYQIIDTPKGSSYSLNNGFQTFSTNDTINSLTLTDTPFTSDLFISNVDLSSVNVNGNKSITLDVANGGITDAVTMNAANATSTQSATFRKFDNASIDNVTTGEDSYYTNNGLGGSIIERELVGVGSVGTNKDITNTENDFIRLQSEVATTNADPSYKIIASKTVGAGSIVNEFEVKRESISSTAYPNTRDDSATTPPINFLYTNSTGVHQSAPISVILSLLIQEDFVTTDLTIGDTDVTATTLSTILQVYRNGRLCQKTEYSIAGLVVTFVDPFGASGGAVFSETVSLIGY